MPWDKMEKLLMDPEKFIAKLKKEKLEVTFKYMAFWALLPAIIAFVLTGLMELNVGGWINISSWLVGLVMGTTTMTGINLGIATAVLVYIGIFVSAIVVGIVAHIVAKIFNGRGDFEDTMKVIVYGTSPAYAFGWLPIFGVFFGLYAVLMQFFAFKELHKMKPVRAAMTVFGVLLVLGVLAAFYNVLGGVFAAVMHPDIALTTIMGTMAALMA